VDQLASVHLFGARLTVERVTADIAEDIRLGTLLPGQVLPLRDVADQRAVRVRSLRTLCAGLERDGLLTLHGDVAIVAPLDLDQVRTTYRHLKVLEPELITCASDQVTPGKLERLRAMIPNDIVDREAASAMVVELFTELCRPAATVFDLRICAEARNNLRRYLRLGFQVLHARTVPDTSRAAEDADRNALCHDILDLYRRGTRGDLRRAITEFRLRGQRIAELSFEGGYPSKRTLRRC
jgi:DNA-binding GntR family transcriptional regulator